MADAAAPATTTAYSILALLAVRPWTAYELAQQMERSVGRMWSSATSVVYEEPKRLVERGWASARKEYTGKRASTVYAITPTGRRALRAWLAEPGAGPSLNYEALVKVAFADHGSLDALRAQLASIRAYVADHEAYAEERRREYAETGGPHPDRLPVIALAARFFEEQHAATRRWVEWAERAVDEWEGVTSSSGASVPDGSWERVGDPLR